MSNLRDPLIINRAEAANRDLGPYFAVPKGLIRGGIGAGLGAAASIVYVALCEHRNRGNGKSFTVSDRTLAADTGVAENTIRGIRKKLISARLIECSRPPGCSFTYTLLPVSGEFIRVADRQRSKQKPRGRAVLPHWLAAKPQHTTPYKHSAAGRS